MASNSYPHNDPAKPLKNTARKIEHEDDVDKEDKRNLVKARSTLRAPCSAASLERFPVAFAIDGP